MAMTAQQNVTIRQIQEVSAANLQACNDSASFIGDTVTTTGVVMMDGGQAFRNNGHALWIKDGNGIWSGINVDDGGEDNAVDALLAGDSIRLTGVVSRFNGETQIDPITGGVTVLGAGNTVIPTVVSVGDLNDATRTNQVVTGEQWEGQYIELIGPLTVVDVTTFSSGTRANVTLADANGNRINIGDRFPAGRSTNSAGGQYVVPQVNTTVYDTIRGVLWHVWPNGCLGNTNSVNNGYEINPFLGSDIVVQSGSSAPLVSGITRSPVVPTSSQDLNVNATIEDVDGTITSATLNYAVGVSNNSYVSIPMTNTAGDNYTAAVPNTAFSDGDFVKYYVCAEDNDNLTTCVPNVPGGSADPLFFVARDNGLTIRDIQFTPFPNGNSGYRDLDVTVTGIVTASAEANSLGTVFMQQPGENQWAGIQLTGNAALANLKEGDEVSITGSVAESFGFTILDDITNVSTLSTGNTSITPTEIDPDNFSSYNFQLNEPYEGMLIRLRRPASKLYIVNENPDGPGSNFGEYRVGSDIFDPANGSRVLAGRNTGSAPGSLNFSYVNDSSWATNNGVMNVPVYKVTYQDSMIHMDGIMLYSFGEMKLLPRRNSDVLGYSGFFGPGVGIEGPLAGSDFAVYPNPASDLVNVRYNFPVAAEATFALRDMLGRVVASQRVSGTEGRIQFSTANFAQGTYVLSVEAEGAVIAHHKVILK